MIAADPTLLLHPPHSNRCHPERSEGSAFGFSRLRVVCVSALTSPNAATLDAASSSPLSATLLPRAAAKGAGPTIWVLSHNVNSHCSGLNAASIFLTPIESYSSHTPYPLTPIESYSCKKQGEGGPPHPKPVARGPMHPCATRRQECAQLQSLHSVYSITRGHPGVGRFQRQKKEFGFFWRPPHGTRVTGPGPLNLGHYSPLHHSLLTVHP